MSSYILKRKNNILGTYFLNGIYTRNKYIIIYQNNNLFGKFFKIKNKYYLELFNKQVYVFNKNTCSSSKNIIHIQNDDNDISNKNLRLEGWFWKNSLKNRKYLLNINQIIPYHKIINNRDRLLTTNQTSEKYLDCELSNSKRIQLINTNNMLLKDRYFLEFFFKNKLIYYSNKNTNLYNFKTEILYLIFRKIGVNTFLTGFCNQLSKIDGIVISAMIILNK